MFSLIEQLQELIKSYYIALTYDKAKAAIILENLRQKRLEIALDAEMRQIFYAQVDVPANASGFQQNVWYSANDINYILRRAVADLADGATIAATNQGNQQRVITREPLAWQHLFPAVQSNAFGQQTLFDFPQELFFEENEALGLAIQGQTTDGFIFYHGCTLKDELHSARREDIWNEIIGYLPEPQLIPLVFQFPAVDVGSIAINAAGGDEIFSSKYDRSLIITEISTTATNSRLTLIDEGRNQLICQRVEMAGVASNWQNPFTTYYKLPYPHLLRKGSRLRMEALNGSILSAEVETADTLKFLTLKGYSM